VVTWCPSLNANHRTVRREITLTLFPMMQRGDSVIHHHLAHTWILSLWFSIRFIFILYTQLCTNV